VGRTYVRITSGRDSAAGPCGGPRSTAGAGAAGAPYPGGVRYLQRGATTAFHLTAAALIVFWTVKDTKPSGAAILPILYAILGASGLIWGVAEWLRP